jgi:hypothetical protein
MTLIFVTMSEPALGFTQPPKMSVVKLERPKRAADFSVPPTAEYVELMVIALCLSTGTNLNVKH